METKTESWYYLRKKGPTKISNYKKDKSNQYFDPWTGNRTKILYLKGKLDETLKETEVFYNKMKKLAENENIEFDPGWIEDVIFSIDTCNSCLEEYMNSRKDDSNSSARDNSVSSWTWQCEKENLQFQR